MCWASKLRWSLLHGCMDPHEGIENIFKDLLQWKGAGNNIRPPAKSGFGLQADLTKNCKTITSSFGPPKILGGLCVTPLTTGNPRGLFPLNQGFPSDQPYWHH
ncbi:hypothetical protein TNCV_2552411 [Trichonephila clavipes]|nr:hypothetical protein TNCV_2552411 [Trichonephila clavipes]